MSLIIFPDIPRWIESLGRIYTRFSGRCRLFDESKKSKGNYQKNHFILMIKQSISKITDK